MEFWIFVSPLSEIALSVSVTELLENSIAETAATDSGSLLYSTIFVLVKQQNACTGHDEHTAGNRRQSRSEIRRDRPSHEKIRFLGEFMASSARIG